MHFKNTMVVGLVVGGLMAGVGATPAVAAPASTAAGSAPEFAPRVTRVGSVVAAGEFAPVAPVVPGTPSNPTPESTTEADARILPIILAAGRAFVAAARGVPGLMAKLTPAIRAGSTAFMNAVRVHAPGAVKVLLGGIAGNAAWEAVKKALGW